MYLAFFENSDNLATLDSHFCSCPFRQNMGSHLNMGQFGLNHFIHLCYLAVVGHLSCPPLTQDLRIQPSVSS